MAMTQAAATATAATTPTKAPFTNFNRNTSVPRTFNRPAVSTAPFVPGKFITRPAAKPFKPGPTPVKAYQPISIDPEAKKIIAELKEQMMEEIGDQFLSHNEFLQLQQKYGLLPASLPDSDTKNTLAKDAMIVMDRAK